MGMDDDGNVIDRYSTEDIAELVLQRRNSGLLGPLHGALCINPPRLGSVPSSSFVVLPPRETIVCVEESLTA